LELGAAVVAAESSTKMLQHAKGTVYKDTAGTNAAATQFQLN